MTSPFEPDSWDRVAAELRACRQSQKQAWGDIDNTTLGRYLADEVTPEERQHVEQALEQRPELRMLTDLVRDVLTEFEPADVPIPASEPRILNFPTPAAKRPAPSKRFGASFRQRSALAAAACLLLALGVALTGPGPGNPDANLPAVALRTDGDRAERLQLPRGGLRLATARKPIQLDDLPPATQLTEAERTAEALEVQGRLQEALALRQTKLPELARRAQKNDETFVVANLNRIGQIYQTQGDLSRAASNYSQARAICETKLGPDHPCTNQADNSLAQVYRSALNNPYVTTPRAEHKFMGSATQTPLPEHQPAQLTPASGNKYVFSPDPRANRDSAPRNASLAAAIVHKQTGEVRRSVVPPLVRGLRQATSAQDRLAYVQALARLGPAAQDAVPTLAELLRQSQDTAERQAIVKALGQMGPSVDRALPVLVEATNCNCPEVCKAAVESLLVHGPDGLVALRRLKEQGAVQQQQFAQTALEQAEPRQLCVGVKDCCELCTVRTITESQNALQFLARHRSLPVYVELVDDSIPKDPKKRDSEAQQLALAQCVCLLIHKEPARVEVRIPEALQRNTRALALQKKLPELLDKPLKARDYDQALRLATQFLTEVAAK